MDKQTWYNLLLDYYYGLLTDKQQKIMRYYYSEDLSLGEIAEQLSISRQAVHDLLRRSQNLLENYEDKLKILAAAQTRSRTDKLITEELLDIKELAEQNMAGTDTVSAATADLIRQKVDAVLRLLETSKNLPEG